MTADAISNAVCNWDEGCWCEWDVVYARYCNPTSLTGPRGKWERLILEHNVRPCAAEGDCTSWTVTPDRRVVVRQPAQATMTLSDSDWLELAGLIDGPELRARLRDGFDCNDANEGSTTTTVTAW